MYLAAAQMLRCGQHVVNAIVKEFPSLNGRSRYSLDFVAYTRKIYDRPSIGKAILRLCPGENGPLLFQASEEGLGDAHHFFYIEPAGKKYCAAWNTLYSVIEAGVMAVNDLVGELDETSFQTLFPLLTRSVVGMESLLRPLLTRVAKMAPQARSALVWSARDCPTARELLNLHLREVYLENLNFTYTLACFWLPSLIDYYCFSTIPCLQNAMPRILNAIFKSCEPSEDILYEVKRLLRYGTPAQRGLEHVENLGCSERTTQILASLYPKCLKK
jgi:hypothetical protein